MGMITPIPPPAAFKKLFCYFLQFRMKSTCFWFGCIPGPPIVGLIPGLGCLSGHSLSIVLTGTAPGLSTGLPWPAGSPGWGAPILALIAGFGCSGKRLPPPTKNIVLIFLKLELIDSYKILHHQKYPDDCMCHQKTLD